MKKTTLLKRVIACLILTAAPAVANAQSAGTIVDVGQGRAGASGNASGQWQLVESKSCVQNGTSSGNALAIGAGPNGLALSHSVGVNRGGVGVGHNFNLAIGSRGTHVSNGGVVSQGGNSRVVVGGNASNGNFGPQGGSTVVGYGRNTKAYSKSRTTPAVTNFGPQTFINSGSTAQGMSQPRTINSFRRMGNR